ncbi:hypothetical protein SLG_22140 [Sphingobium sp. SYK-6]|uniref:hypothetical protein n=1 Tax=Sphingobium sp. (strain NBRC 103272 / SYK-6) TaxID=627192 RepID=UPI0002277135|nr:hypothetical protein [Sphingobium sp. SYK-6]BAK66889.1 hypothetical protein SLG_22140 [Sphingobium sp. SYK-6]
MDQPLAERMLRALLIQLLKSEAIDPDDIDAAADRLAADGDGEAAHEMRCLIVESMAPEQSDWEADQRRSRFRVVDGDDGKPTA